MKQKLIVLGVVMLLITCCSLLFTCFQTNGSITKEQAVSLAERFIAENGYTTLPANKSTLSRELTDVYENIDTLLKYRYNTLHSKAFCFGKNEDSWDIGFLSTTINLNKLDSLARQSNLEGKAVIVSTDGKNIRMAHKTPLFSHFKKM